MFPKCETYICNQQLLAVTLPSTKNRTCRPSEWTMIEIRFSNLELRIEIDENVYVNVLHTCLHLNCSTHYHYYHLRADILIPCIIYTSLIKLSNGKCFFFFIYNLTETKKNINFDIKSHRNISTNAFLICINLYPQWCKTIFFLILSSCCRQYKTRFYIKVLHVWKI